MEYLRCIFLLGSLLSVHAVQECPEGADIIFLVDSSWSIRDSNPVNSSVDNWQLIKEFVKGIVDALPTEEGGVRIGVVKFSTEVDEDELVYLNTYDPGNKAGLLEKISNLAFYPGNTNTSGALRTMYDSMIDGFHGGRAEIRKIAILLTDGLSNVDSDKTVPEARAAKALGIKIFSIGITRYADGSELEEIASDPVNFHYIFVNDFANLPSQLDRLLSRLCEPTPPAMPCTDARADVVFLLDNSGSIGEKDPKNDTGYHWNLLKQFVVEVVRNLQVEYLGTRVAIIRFSDLAEVMFPLNKYKDKTHIIRAIMDLENTKGATNTSGALRTMREIVFSAANGDRSAVRNIGIIITDGESTVDQHLTFQEAKKTHDANIKMFAIGLTDYINVKELRAVASEPGEDYYFNTTKISYVETLVSRLVWGVCHAKCEDLTPEERAQSDRCKNLNKTACPEGKYEWVKFSGHLLIGHNYARIQHVGSAGECQRICLQDPYCRSIDWVWSVNECAVSYDTKQEAGDSFAEDSGSDYYELNCAVSYETSGGPSGSGSGVNGTSPGGGPGSVTLKPDAGSSSMGTTNSVRSVYLLVLLAAGLWVWEVSQ